LHGSPSVTNPRRYAAPSPPRAGFFFWRTIIDRVIIYPGQVPLETDVLSTNKNAMFALGQFAQDVFGTSTIFSGLACVPNTPAAMNVIVQPGAVYAQAALDATAYSSLAADSTVTMKQGILKAAQTFATPAPVTAGQSIVYLISGAFLEADTGATVLPYYNASNPAQAYSGPNNLGTSQNTLRQDTVQLTLTTGVPATTGSQLTPATPVGQTALYTITVAYGASTVVAGNIAKVSGAPFLSSSILAQIQAPVPGRLLRTSVYSIVSGTQQVSVNGGASTTTGATTHTPLAATTLCDVEVQGGGGGGGGSNAITAGLVSNAVGGGSGGYARGVYAPATRTITVGAGGAGGIAGNNAGGAGSTSSYGSAATATGGGGGGGGGLGASPPSTNGFSASGAGSGGTIVNTGGGIGSTPISMTVTNCISGPGGSSYYGGGASSVSINQAGVAASTPGSGGGGACSAGSGSSNLPGGAGAAGLVIVREYS
jgi:hypothetical protein